jgi:hypothetical protein
MASNKEKDKPETKNQPENAAQKPEDKKPEKPKIIERPCVEELPIDLTKDELIAYAQESARLTAEVGSMELKKKLDAAKMKTEIDATKQRIGELSDRISSGIERREVDCIWRFDFEKGFKTLIHRQPIASAMVDRNDGKGFQPDYLEREIRCAPISVDERQMSLPIKETMADKVAKAKDAKDEKSNALIDEKAEDPANETPNEKAIRVWCNGLDRKHRAAAFGIAEANMGDIAIQDLFNLPYRHMSQEHKQRVQEAFKNRDKAPRVAESEVVELPGIGMPASEAVQ